MRHRDFGQPTGVLLSSGDVSVSTTFTEESRATQKLQIENKEHLDPWRTPMDTDSSETKIFSIKYKDKVVGQIILWDFQNKNVRSCSISYWIAKEFINKGIGTRAVELTCDYAFNELDVDEIDATVQPENIASIKLLEKLKFPHRKMIGDRKFFRGSWKEYLIYTMTKEPNAYL